MLMLLEILWITAIVLAAAGSGAGAVGPLEGKWRKTSTSECSKHYPDELEFFGARYLGRKGSSGQTFIMWDAGTYAHLPSGHVKISTATDEQVDYRFRLDGETLIFTDKQDCEFRYVRQK
jgi:hypothetical protein